MSRVTVGEIAIVETSYRNSFDKRPTHGKRPGTLFSADVDKHRRSAPLKQKAQTPGTR